MDTPLTPDITKLKAEFGEEIGEHPQTGGESRELTGILHSCSKKYICGVNGMFPVSGLNDKVPFILYLLRFFLIKD